MTRNIQGPGRTQPSSKIKKPGFYASTVAHSSATDEWATPQSTFDAINTEFEFGLDVCALQSSAKTVNWYGPDHADHTRLDGLEQDWTGDAQGSTIWMNPPYGTTIGKWMHKAVEETNKGATVVCLLPVRTDTRWFQDTVLALQQQDRAEIRFIRGRLKFGNARTGAPFPSAIVVLKP